jgi:hypothetical protein
VIYALATALIAQTAAFMWVFDRKDKRERDERQVLLQRIQAPEAAVYEHATRSIPEDEGAYPASDEEIADQQERDRVLAFIERHEA